MSQVDKTHESWAVQTTTDAYVDLGTPWYTAPFKTVNLLIKNTGATNGAKVQVLGSVDDGVLYDIVAGSEQTIALSSQYQFKITDYYTHLKVQIKAAVGAAQTTVSAKGCAIGA